MYFAVAKKIPWGNVEKFLSMRRRRAVGDIAGVRRRYARELKGCKEISSYRHCKDKLNILNLQKNGVKPQLKHLNSEICFRNLPIYSEIHHFCASVLRIYRVCRRAGPVMIFRRRFG